MDTNTVATTETFKPLQCVCSVALQVQKSAEEAKENLDANRPHTKFCFIRQARDEEEEVEERSGGNLVEGERMKATMNILNPDSGIGNFVKGGRD